MPKDRLAYSQIYQQREYLEKIRQESRELKQSLLTLFALAGHDFPNSMGAALMQYQGAREEDLRADLLAFLYKIPDRIFNKSQFNPEAAMDRPNLAYILKFMNTRYSEQMFRQWKSAEGTELPSQEMLSELDPPAKQVEITLEPGVFLFAGAALAALFFLG